MVLLLVLLLLGSSVAADTPWTCRNVTQIDNFSFQQVEGGPWYILEEFLPFPGNKYDWCHVHEFHNASGVLQIRIRTVTAHTVKDQATELKLHDDDDALWELPEEGMPAKVVHLSADRQLMALSLCASPPVYGYSYVLGRNSSGHGDLEDVHELLMQRGVSHTDRVTTFNLSRCTAENLETFLTPP